MKRLTALMLLSTPLIACQASVSEDFVEAIPSTTQESTADVAAIPATHIGIYTGTADLSALTSTRWVVSEGSGGSSASCRVQFSKTASAASTAAAARGLPNGMAATSGCMNEELSSVTAWAVNGDTIELRDAQETTTAYLLMERPDLLLGYTAKGHDLVVSQ
ncbi:AprI/Inh family metalloprotease inhibitor [Pseudovibrio japonicus]|nr:AprI/Inh family metalloprotease inhibitor [Pseudovibrio japonicus]